jgi:hypothetical protein
LRIAIPSFVSPVENWRSWVRAEFWVDKKMLDAVSARIPGDAAGK